MRHSWGMGNGLCLPLTLQDPACHDSDTIIRVTQKHGLMVILHGQGLCGYGDYLLPWGHLEIPLLVIKRDLEESLTYSLVSEIRKLKSREVKSLPQERDLVRTWARQSVCMDSLRQQLHSWGGSPSTILS